MRNVTRPRRHSFPLRLQPCLLSVNSLQSRINSLACSVDGLGYFSGPLAGIQEFIEFAVLVGGPTPGLESLISSPSAPALQDGGWLRGLRAYTASVPQDYRSETLSMVGVGETGILLRLSRYRCPVISNTAENAAVSAALAS
jgi:hypothetical protein